MDTEYQKYQKRVDRTARAISRAMEKLWDNGETLAHCLARWHLRHGGRAPRGKKECASCGTPRRQGTEEERF